VRVVRQHTRVKENKPRNLNPSGFLAVFISHEGISQSWVNMLFYFIGFLFSFSFFLISELRKKLNRITKSGIVTKKFPKENYSSERRKASH
jgi:hypothetical protein